MNTQSLTCTGSVGQLAMTLYQPDGATSLLLLMHGFMSSQRYPLFSRLIRRLYERGVAVLTFDFNGHGRSDGRFSNMTVLNELEDARRVYAYARALPWVEHIFLAGHSQGGVVAGLLAGELGYPAISALIQMAPAAVLHDDALEGHIMNATFNPNDLPPYVRVFFFKKVGRAYFEVAQQLDIYGRSCCYTGPVRLIHGDCDDVVPLRYSQQYAERYPSAELFVLPSETHMLTRQRPRLLTLCTDFILANQSTASL